MADRERIPSIAEVAADGHPVRCQARVERTVVSFAFAGPINVNEFLAQNPAQTAEYAACIERHSERRAAARARRGELAARLRLAPALPVYTAEITFGDVCAHVTVRFGGRRTMVSAVFFGPQRPTEDDVQNIARIVTRDYGIELNPDPVSYLVVFSMSVPDDVEIVRAAGRFPRYELQPGPPGNHAVCPSTRTAVFIAKHANYDELRAAVEAAWWPEGPLADADEAAAALEHLDLDVDERRRVRRRRRREPHYKYATQV